MNIRNIKILFLADTNGNSGPINVNKCIVNNLSDSMWIVSSKNKYGKIIEGCIKLMFSDVVVTSAVARQGYFFYVLAKLLKKKTAHIMHGCDEYEVEINQQYNMDKGIRLERFLLRNADLLLPVSEKFSHWVCERYPQYAYKTGYLYNGIDLDLLSRIQPGKKKRGFIAAAGADRGVKNNIVVARAVEKMRGKAYLEVYGHIYHQVPQDMLNVKYVGALPNDQYLKKLAEAELFVLNSIFETFSISAIEALMAGCSVLLSEVAGVTGILELEECDIIHDPMDEEEITRKIEYLLEHPNNERIMAKLDLDEWSYRKSVERLEKICMDLLKESR